MYRVKEVAEISGVSVRTLHYYDKIGLLKPSMIGENGYRYYDHDALITLQQILFFKELDFSLNLIKQIMLDENFDQKEALINHRNLLEKKKHRLQNLIHTIDQTFRSMEEGKVMSKKKLFEHFNMDDIKAHEEKYAEETKEKYGHTDAYKQSFKRTANFTETDWQGIQEQSNQIYKGLASLMNREPNDKEVQGLIGQWHGVINQFYDCPPEMFKGLGDMYVNDSRFTKNIDQYGKGLSQFMKDAMYVYSEQI